MATKVLIAEKHELVRETLSSYLARQPGYKTAVAATLDEAKTRVSVEGPFGVIILDLDLPGMSEFRSLDALLALNRGQPVAIMSSTVSRRIAANVLAAGAAGFLPKSMSARSLLNVIDLILSGERYVPASYLAEEEPPDLAADLVATLSPRERMVLSRIGLGQANAEIAADLGVGVATVKHHVTNICQKLDARNRTHAALLGREARLI